MDVFNAVRTVLAVRQFDSRPIPSEVVHQIIDAAWLTASSRNLQPLSLIHI